jgi:hypothetical protein
LPLSDVLNFLVAGRGGLSQTLQNPEQYPPPLPLASAQKISSLLWGMKLIHYVTMLSIISSNDTIDNNEKQSAGAKMLCLQ